MKTPQPLPDPVARAPFTFQEALDAGASYRRLRHRGLVSPSRGIRIPCGAEPAPGLAPLVRPFTRVTAFTAASHATAFRLWEMPGFCPVRTARASTCRGLTPWPSRGGRV